ncbi:MAG: ferredoxin, partial [Vicinamibacteria bacterium]
PPLGTILFQTVSRAFPFLTHDPDAGPALADRLCLQGNPAPESPWPVYTLPYLDDQNVEKKLDIPLTIADWAATEGRFKASFALLPREEWDASVPFDQYLRLPRQERADKIAFIHSVGADRHLRRLRVEPDIARLADERLEFWSHLRELAGLDVSKTARKTMEAGLEAKLAAVRAEYEDRMAELKREYPKQIARRLAEGLMEHGAGGALSELLSSLPAAKASAGERPAAAKKTEASTPPPAPAPPAAPASESAAPPPPAAAAPVAKDDEPLTFEAYIDSARCTTCNECTNLNKRMFAYNAAKQAEIKDASAGTFQQLVLAAERCPVSIIHPGSPRNQDEKDLDKWVKRAERFN